MVRRTFIIIAVLWAIVLLGLSYLYFGKHYRVYMNTVPQEVSSQKGESSTSLPDSAFVLQSSAFIDGASIPAQYTCDEKQISPPLSVHGAPEGTKSLVLIMEDRDVPKSLVPTGVFLHWLLFNIPADTEDIEVGEVAGTLGASGNGVAGYVGPCPPTNIEPHEHRYYFDLYALDTALTLQEGASVTEVRSAMEGHILKQTTLMGRYARREK